MLSAAVLVVIGVAPMTVEDTLLPPTTGGFLAVHFLILDDLAAVIHVARKVSIPVKHNWGDRAFIGARRGDTADHGQRIDGDPQD